MCVLGKAEMFQSKINVVHFTMFPPWRHFTTYRYMCLENNSKEECGLSVLENQFQDSGVNLV